MIPFGITDASTTALVGTLMNGMGIPGGIICAVILMKVGNKRLREVSLCSIAALLMSFIYYTLALRPASIANVEAAAALVGFFTTPIMICGYELAVKQTRK